MRPQEVVHLTFHGLCESLPARSGKQGDHQVQRNTFEDIISEIKDEPNVEISFDDGNASDVQVALPILLEAGITATFFVLAGKLGQSGYLSPSDVLVLADSGMRIGTHGMHHRSWRRLGAREEQEELFAARDVLQELTGKPIDWAACPFGAYDRRTLSKLRRAGYHRVFTSDGGIALRDAWLQPRCSVRRDDDPTSVLARIRAEPDPITEQLRRLKLMLKRLR